MPARRSLVLLFAFCLFLVGCSGNKGVNVQGKLILPQNVTPGEKGVVRITFVPEDSNGKAAVGKYSAKDGSFVANMTPGKGIRPGKYKIAVHVTPYNREEANEQAAALRQLNNAYADATGSKLSYEVTREPTQSITIDLTAGTVTKN
jgi:hypothetical protein